VTLTCKNESFREHVKNFNKKFHLKLREILKNKRENANNEFRRENTKYVEANKAKIPELNSSIGNCSVSEFSELSNSNTPM